MIHFNDYYFLTDPEEFVYNAMASDPAWQLLQSPFSIEKFASMPHLIQPYFTHGVKLKSEFSSQLHSQNGETSVIFHADDNTWDGYLNYELFYNDAESESPLPDHSLLDRFVLMERLIGTWNFRVRYPAKGVYKLSIIIGTERSEYRLCHFKLYGDKIANDIKPLPYNPGTNGWGPNLNTEKGGLESPSQKNGIVLVESLKITIFKFSLRETVTHVRSELVQNNIAAVSLKQYVRQTVEFNRLQVKVSLPEVGEYGLRLYSTVKKTNIETNVCNYLLTCQSTRKPRREVSEVQYFFVLITFTVITFKNMQSFQSTVGPGFMCITGLLHFILL